LLESVDVFDGESQRVIRECHLAFSELVEAVPGRIRSASDLQRALQINMKLAWKIYRIANDDSLDAGMLMPGQQNVREIVRVATERGIDPGIIEKITRSMDEFDRLVSIHAGERSIFDSMISARGSDDQGETLALSQKRSAFRVNRNLRGVHAKSQLKTLILAPSQEGRCLLDMVAIQGYQELSRLRYDCPLVVSCVRISDDDRHVRRTSWEPLGSGTDHRGDTSLLGEFCSPDLPPFREVRTVDDFVMGELVGGGIGKQSAITHIDGYIARAAVPGYRDGTNKYGGMLVWVPIPCEVLVVDLVVHEDALGHLNPLVGCYSSMLSGSRLPEEMESCDRLPLKESMVYLGRGLPVLRSSDIHRHAEMYSAVFEKLSWAPEQFEVYRCRVAFPIMLSSVMIRFDLPERPSSP